MHEGIITEVSANRNTVAVVAKFDETQEDVRLFADGEEVHPLIFNPIDGMHHSMIWLEEGKTINKLEGMNTTAVEEGSWTTLTTPKIRPARAQTLVVSPNGSGEGAFTHASPGDLLTAVKMAVAQGDTEIVLKDGIYRQAESGDSDYMAAFQKADGAPFAGITIVAESPRHAIISNLLDDRNVKTTLADSATGLYQVDGVPRPVHQLHAVVNGRVERLQEKFSKGVDWTEDTLKASPIGGWFLDSITDQLLVKLPDGSDPCGKLRISDPTHAKAWLFADGSDIWIEGVIFDYWLRTIPPTSIPQWELGSCANFHRCQEVIIRHCESRYAIDYAFHFYACTNYLVEDCDFVDGQSYTTYITMRVGLARFGGTVRNYNSALGVIRHNRWHQCFVANQFVSSPNSATQHIEFHHNTVRQARNIPVALAGNGGHHAIWANRFATCGLAMPNVEQGAPISPTYWINNLAVDAGYFGVFFADETQRVIKGNRFGGGRSPRIGQYFFYYNTLRTEWFPPNGEGAETIQRINAWQASGKDHSASRYINNILTSLFEEIGVSSTNARAIWFHEGADTEGNPGLHLVNLSQMQWDYNQYFWNRREAGTSTDKDAFCIGLSGLNFTFAEMQKWVKENVQQDWEENGAFQDPQFDAQSQPTNAIAATTIAGITGNAVLEEPGSVSGATIRRY